MSDLIRPAATETDKKIFNQLLQRISTVDSYFCCGGTLELFDRPLTLYYKSADKSNDNWIDFCGMHEQSETEHQIAIEKLLQACVPAPHGRGDETVLDESYRLARELRQGDFALSIDPLSEAGAGALSSITALTAGRTILSQNQGQVEELRGVITDANKSVPNLTIVPRVYKLNTYAKNGFFKSHRDTPKGNGHIGTLMIALPISHQGGALRINHDGKEFVFDWHEQCSQGIEVSQDGKVKVSLPWAFLFSDVEHEVLPVESGTRVTIAYDIFSSQASVREIGPPISNMSGTTIPLYEDFVAALRNPSFLSKGAEVAIALSHSYPMARNGKELKLNNEEFAAGLKGLDALVYRALKAAGFDVSLRAVMERDLYRHPKGIPDDGYGPLIDGYHYKTLITSDTFTYGNSDRDMEYDEYETVLKEDFGIRDSPELMWVKKPIDTFINIGSYNAYSNEHSVEFFLCRGSVYLECSSIWRRISGFLKLSRKISIHNRMSFAKICS